MNDGRKFLGGELEAGSLYCVFRVKNGVVCESDESVEGWGWGTGEEGSSSRGQLQNNQ